MKYNTWTYDKCRDVALKFQTRREFFQKSGSAYNYARRNHILDNVCEHMQRVHNPKNYWTYDKCRDEALKFQTRNEYRIKSGSSYIKASNNDWLNDICSHMKSIGNRMNRCVYAYEFEDKSVYVGITHNLNERQKSRDNDISDSVTNHIRKTNLTPIRKQLTDYINVDDASKLEGIYLNKYKGDNWIILNQIKTGGIGGSYCRWTKEKCICAAKKCSSKKEFYEKHRGAYSSSLRNGWLNEIYPIFGTIYAPPNKYFFDYCKQEALKYETKLEFKKNNSGAYNASLRNNWHKLICNHMIYANRKWTREKCLKVIMCCNSKKELRKKYCGTYHAIMKNKWSDLFNYYK